jgi:hypothetical protein
MPHTIRDRSILIEMQRRKDSEHLERFLFRRIRPEAEKLSLSLTTYVEGHREAIEAAYAGTALDFIEDRDAEAWESLFAVLSVADPSRCEELKECALVLTGQKSAGEREENLSIRLLADLREVWPKGQKTAFTAHLIGLLRAIDDAPWATDVDLNPRKLARFLRPFRVEPGQVRVKSEGKTAKGYHLSELESAFNRYLGSERKHGKQYK